jgi:hypothetical protein
VTSKAILRTIRDTFVIFGRNLTGQYRPAVAPVTVIARPQALSTLRAFGEAA